MKDIVDTLDAKMGSPLRWKTSLCDRTEIRSERTPVVHRAAAYYSLRH